MAAVSLGKRERGIIAADATTNASEVLTRFVVAWAATEAVRIAELDQWRIRERRTQRGLVVPCRLSRNWKSHAKVALKDDVAGSLFILLFAATAEEEY